MVFKSTPASRNQAANKLISMYKGSPEENPVYIHKSKLRLANGSRARLIFIDE
jgi:hypothetical protein